SAISAPSPLRMCTSAWLRPNALTWTTVWPALGSGSGISRISSTSGPPNCFLSIARMSLPPGSSNRQNQPTQVTWGDNPLTRFFPVILGERVSRSISMPDRPPPFFVGDHLALDFLNTVATPKDVSVEWLRDGRDLIDWLEQAIALPTGVAARFGASNEQGALDRVARRAREFREWLRGVVTRHMGKPLTTGAAKALGPLNDLLAGDDSYPVVEAPGGKQAPRLRRVRRWES